MAREKKSYGTALGILNGTSIVNPPKEDKQIIETNKVDKDVNQDLQKDVSIDVNINSTHKNETNSLDDLSKNINEMFEEKTKKKTMEETHTRKTFLIENDLLKEFNKLTKNKRGYQTMLINEVLRAVIKSHSK